jgi:hypothetical protein
MPHSRIPESHSNFSVINQMGRHYKCWQGIVTGTGPKKWMADDDDD